MTAPVTVISSVVLVPCLLPFDSGCANASGVSSAQQTRMAIGFFMIRPPVDGCALRLVPFTEEFSSACCTKFRFLSSLAFSVQSSGLLLFCLVLGGSFSFGGRHDRWPGLRPLMYTVQYFFSRFLLTWQHATCARARED